MEEYKGYILRNRNGMLYTSKPRPYDDADYFWARSEDERHWKVIRKGRVIRNFVGCFEMVVDYLEYNNKSIKPIMVHY